MALLGSGQMGNRYTGNPAPGGNGRMPAGSGMPMAGRNGAPGQQNGSGKVDRNQKDSVLFGNELRQEVPEIVEDNPVMYLKGCDKLGNHREIPVSGNMLSRHMMLIGGIGTGKTNAFFQMISQIKNNLTNDDVMIIFFFFLDFYKEFYETGDAVISNDGTAV